MKKEEVKIIINSYSYIKPYIKKILLILMFVIIGVILSIVQPVLWGHMLEAVIKLDINKFIKLITYLLLLYIIETFTTFCQSYLRAYVNECAICEMKGELFKKILNYQMRLIDKMGVGDVLSHLEGDVQVIVDVYTNQILNIVIGVLKTLIIGTLALAISWPLALVIILMLPLNYIIVDRFGSKMQLNQLTLRTNMDKYYTGTQEYIVGLKSIKSQGVKNLIFGKFRRLIEENKLIGIKISALISGSSGLVGLINFFTQIIVYSVGMYLLIQGRLTFAIFVAFSAYSVSLSGALLDITQVNPKLQQAVISIKRINKILDEFEENQELWGCKNFENIKGDIMLEHISFGYDKLLFKDISISFQANRKYGIVGVSGSGKSSLFGLLLKIYNPSTGRIIFDGQDINDINENDFRKNIGVVQQEPILFNMSILDNIKLEQSQATIEQVFNAAKMAHIDEDIRKMQDGYNTIVNSTSDNLSVGQKQRIALARTLLKNPKIILFDEVTSALDNISQELVNDSINSLRATHTIFVISHKISSIIDSDEIIVMNCGKIAGKGSHHELLRNCYYYKKMFTNEDVV